ncbi:hypothetical protein TI39_contig70g00013 [Zymoseptoria brevis]|uniref:Uncharacterized protein n=1 Tax=Zymoseptoria brevis TaxID=1047168 RepID=A0A0F4GYD7_9PEZI|nr:hypothetical protein TI39_contig70g00013 [Zymoseptoria brevis]
MARIQKPGAELDLSTDASMQVVLHCSALELSRLKSAARDRVHKCKSHSAACLGGLWSSLGDRSPSLKKLLEGCLWGQHCTPADFHTCKWEVQRHIFRSVTDDVAVERARDGSLSQTRVPQKRPFMFDDSDDEYSRPHLPKKKTPRKKAIAKMATPAEEVIPTTIQSPEDSNADGPAHTNNSSAATSETTTNVQIPILKAAEATATPQPFPPTLQDQSPQPVPPNGEPKPMTNSIVIPQIQWTIESFMKDIEARARLMVQTGVETGIAEERAKWENEQTVAEQNKTRMWDGKLAEHQVAVASWRSDLAKREEMLAYQEAQLSDLKKMLTEQERSMALATSYLEQQKLKWEGEMTERERMLQEREKLFAEAKESLKPEELERYDSAMRAYVRRGPKSTTDWQAWSAVEITNDLAAELVSGSRWEPEVPDDFDTCVSVIQNFMWERAASEKWDSPKPPKPKSKKRGSSPDENDSGRDPNKFKQTSTEYFNEYLVRTGKMRMTALHRKNSAGGQLPRAKDSRHQPELNVAKSAAITAAGADLIQTATQAASEVVEMKALPVASTSESRFESFGHAAHNLRAAAGSQVQNAIDYRAAVNGHANDIEVYIQGQVEEQVKAGLVKERTSLESAMSALKYQERDSTIRLDGLKQRESEFAEEKLQWEKNFADEKVEWEAGMRSRMKVEAREDLEEREQAVAEQEKALASRELDVARRQDVVKSYDNMSNMRRQIVIRREASAAQWDKDRETEKLKWESELRERVKAEVVESMNRLLAVK